MRSRYIGFTVVLIFLLAYSVSAQADSKDDLPTLTVSDKGCEIVGESYRWKAAGGDCGFNDLAAPIQGRFLVRNLQCMRTGADGKVVERWKETEERFVGPCGE